MAGDFAFHVFFLTGCDSNPFLLKLWQWLPWKMISGRANSFGFANPGSQQQKNSPERTYVIPCLEQESSRCSVSAGWLELPEHDPLSHFRERKREATSDLRERAGKERRVRSHHSLASKILHFLAAKTARLLQSRELDSKKEEQREKPKVCQCRVPSEFGRMRACDLVHACEMGQGHPQQSERWLLGPWEGVEESKSLRIKYRCMFLPMQ